MTFLEQIRANNDPNSPERVKARELLANMEAHKVPFAKETRTVIGHNGLGNVEAIIDENGENWMGFKVDFI